MKKRKILKKSKENGEKILQEYIAFGNKKKVFGRITLATGVLTLIGAPIFLKNQTFLVYFLIIWILQAIYILLYLKFKRNKK